MRSRWRRLALRAVEVAMSMHRGILYLVAVMEWFDRKVFFWRLSNTMEADICVAALEDAIARYGRPDIFNTDPRPQFTSFAFTNRLKDAGVRISINGRGRWMDNVFIERLWRSLKYECVFLNAFETGAARRGSESLAGSAIAPPSGHTPCSAAEPPTRSMISSPRRRRRRNWRRNPNPIHLGQAA